jgi:hypothetical protein
MRRQEDQNVHDLGFDANPAVSMDDAARLGLDEPTANIKIGFHQLLLPGVGDCVAAL